MFKFLGKQEDAAADDLVVPVDEKVIADAASAHFLPLLSRIADSSYILRAMSDGVCTMCDDV